MWVCLLSQALYQKFSSLESWCSSKSAACLRVESHDKQNVFKFWWLFMGRCSFRNGKGRKKAETDFWHLLESCALDSACRIIWTPKLTPIHEYYFFFILFCFVFSFFLLFCVFLAFFCLLIWRIYSTLVLSTQPLNQTPCRAAAQLETRPIAWCRSSSKRVQNSSIHERLMISILETEKLGWKLWMVMASSWLVLHDSWDLYLHNSIGWCCDSM